MMCGGDWDEICPEGWLHYCGGDTEEGWEWVAEGQEKVKTVSQQSRGDWDGMLQLTGLVLKTDS